MKKTLEEKIHSMQIGGKILGQILKSLLKNVTPRMTGIDLDNQAEYLIRQAGGFPSFKMVPNYRWSTCICVNDVVVHGIPDRVPFQSGDLVGIDIGMYYQGYHTDAAWTVTVGDNDDEQVRQNIQKFLDTGKHSLRMAIQQAKVGKRIGHISQVIQQTTEKEGYHVVRTLVGHGVGKKLHEEPEIPGILSRTLVDTPELLEGMTLAIEVIYSQGSGEVVYDRDGWTIRTKDRALAGLFEHTVVIREDRAVVLTET